jgi:hypothetical protein
VGFVRVHFITTAINKLFLVSPKLFGGAQFKKIELVLMPTIELLQYLITVVLELNQGILSVSSIDETDHLFPCQAAGLVRYFFCAKKVSKENNRTYHHKSNSIIQKKTQKK